MVDANDVAAGALRARFDEPEDAFPASRLALCDPTVAGLLGARHRAEALPGALAPLAPGGRLGGAEPERERVIATLERWLENLRRTRR
jgi:hypothetical protein